MSRPHPCRRLEICHHHPSLVYHWEELLEETVCPLCTPEEEPAANTAPGSQERKNHVLKVHWKQRLPYADGYLLPCLLSSCRPHNKAKPHYHCPGCTQLVEKIGQIRRHVYSCANTMPPWVRRVEEDIIAYISKHGRSREPLCDMKFVGLPGWQVEADLEAEDEDVPTPCPQIIPAHDCDIRQARQMLMYQFAEEHQHFTAASRDFLSEHKQWIGKNYHESHVHSLFDVKLRLCIKSCCRSGSLYHCPLCPPSQRGLGWLPIHTHLSARHWKERITHKGLQLLVCNLPCRGEQHPHHHCPECGHINCSMADFQRHLQDHSKTKSTTSGCNPSSVTLNTSGGSCQKTQTDVTPTQRVTKQGPGKVFAMVGAVLVPELLRAIPGCQSSFFRQLEADTGVRTRGNCPDRCMLHGDWEALNKAYTQLEALSKKSAGSASQGSGDSVLNMEPTKKYVMNLKIPSQKSPAATEASQASRKRSCREQKGVTVGKKKYDPGSSNMNPSVSLCQWSTERLLRSWRQLPSCDRHREEQTRVTKTAADSTSRHFNADSGGVCEASGASTSVHVNADGGGIPPPSALTRSGVKFVDVSPASVPSPTTDQTPTDLTMTLSAQPGPSGGGMDYLPFEDDDDNDDGTEPLDLEALLDEVESSLAEATEKPVGASFTAEVNPGLAKPPSNVNGGLTKLGLTATVKPATEVPVTIESQPSAGSISFKSEASDVGVQTLQQTQAGVVATVTSADIEGAPDGDHEYTATQSQTHRSQSPTLQQSPHISDREALGLHSRGKVNCPFCPATFCSQQRWLKHLLVSVCGDKRLDQLPEHIASRLRETRETVTTPQCPLCKHEFTRLLLARKHYLFRSCEEKKKTKQLWEQCQITTDETTGRFKCLRCPCTFRTKRYARTHFLRVHSEKNLPCTLCHRQFSTTRWLRHHMRISHGSMVSCNICGKTISKNSALVHKKRHIRNNDKPPVTPAAPVLSLVCPVKGCSFKTFKQTLMLRHTRMKHHCSDQHAASSTQSEASAKCVMNFQLPSKSSAVKPSSHSLSTMRDAQPGASGVELDRMLFDDDDEDNDPLDLDSMTICLDDIVDMPGDKTSGGATESVADEKAGAMWFTVVSKSAAEATVPSISGMAASEANVTSISGDAVTLPNTTGVMTYPVDHLSRARVNVDHTYFTPSASREEASDDPLLIEAGPYKASQEEIKRIRSIRCHRFCPVCEKTFSSSARTWRHWFDSECGNDDIAKLPDSVVNQLWQIRQTITTRQCPLCKNTFEKLNEARRHYLFRSCVEAARIEERWEKCQMTVNDDTGDFQCSRCASTFKKKDQALKHFLRMHSANSVACSRCQKQFSARDQLTRHIRRSAATCSGAVGVHLDEFPSWDPSQPKPEFTCSMAGCGFMTSKQILLTHHTQIEHGPKEQDPVLTPGVADVVAAVEVVEDTSDALVTGDRIFLKSINTSIGQPGTYGVELDQMSFDDEDDSQALDLDAVTVFLEETEESSSVAPVYSQGVVLTEDQQLGAGSLWYEVVDGEIQQLDLFNTEHAYVPGIKMEPAFLQEPTFGDLPGIPLGSVTMEAMQSAADSSSRQFQEYCPLCKKGFVSKARLWSHLCSSKCGKKYDRLPEDIASKLMESREAVTSKQCPLCQRTFFKLTDAQRHHLLRICERTDMKRWDMCQMTVDDTTGQIQCSQCPRVFKKKSRAISHFLGVHAEKTVPCSECPQLFATESLQRRHLRVSHGSLIQCHICGKMLKQRCVRNHMKRHEAPGSMSASGAGRAAKSQREFTCKVPGCGWKGLGQPKMFRHTKIVHGSHDQICTVCSKAFAIRADLKKHFNSCHNPASRQTVPCPHCQKLVRTSNLRRHILQVHTKGGKLYQCSKCNRNFHSGFNLRRHIEASERRGEDCSQLKPFKCPECDACYSNQRTLTHHCERVHGHPSRFPCKKCNKRFPTRRLLQEHMDSHRGERYRCNICDLSFTTSKGLRRHHLRHEVRSKDNSCACGMQFPCYASLVIHHRHCPHAPPIVGRTKPKPNYVRPARKKKSTKAKSSAPEQTQSAASFLNENVNYSSEQVMASHSLSGMDLLEVPDSGLTQEFQCGYCQVVFPQLDQINAHILTAHPNAARLAGVMI